MDTVIDLSVVNSLFGDNASPLDVVSWLLTQKYHQTRGLPYTINGVLQLTYSIAPGSNEINLYIPFIWSSADSEIKAMNIIINQSTNNLEIYPCQVDGSNRPYFLASIKSILIQGYNNVCEVSTLEFMDTKDKLISLRRTIPSYASSGKNLISALFAIGRVFRFKWFFASDASTISCGIPFLIYRLLAGKNTLQESRGFTQIQNPQQEIYRVTCNEAINSLRLQLIDQYLGIAPSLVKYRGRTVGEVFTILNTIYDLDDCEDVKRLVQWFIDNIYGMKECYSMEYTRPVLVTDYPPK